MSNGTLKRITKGEYESTDGQFKVVLQPKRDGAKYAMWGVYHASDLRTLHDEFETIGEVKAYVAPKILPGAFSDVPTSDQQAMAEADKLLAAKEAASNVRQIFPKPELQLTKANAIAVGKYVREVDPDQFKQITKNIKSKSLEKVGVYVYKTDTAMFEQILAA